MTFGLIIIGDEILSGRRVDQHFSTVIELLSARGLALGWATIIGDKPEQIVETLKRTSATDDVVLCCGGIGATPDDYTRAAAARAFGLELTLHPEAKALIEERILQTQAQAGQVVPLSEKEHVQRLKMGEFPLGSRIIPNPYNLIPGFSVAKHYFMPGFPIMAKPMMAWVLDTYYSDLFFKRPWAEKALRVFEVAEATLTPLMETLERDYPLIKIFSLPSVGDQNMRRHIELGVKGDPEQVVLAFESLQVGLRQYTAEYVLC